MSQTALALISVGVSHSSSPSPTTTNRHARVYVTPPSVGQPPLEPDTGLAEHGIICSGVCTYTLLSCCFSIRSLLAVHKQGFHGRVLPLPKTAGRMVNVTEYTVANRPSPGAPRRVELPLGFVRTYKSWCNSEIWFSFYRHKHLATTCFASRTC
jgi:hypothetical protein